MTETSVAVLREIPSEVVALDELTEHPRNYQGHPPEQLEHLRQSLTEHGQYRNIVVATDNTILAGHGVAQAARGLGWSTVEVKRVPYGPDDPMALKLLAGDNELERLAAVNDRALTEILRDVGNSDVTTLLGTGFDESMLGALVLQSRPRHEIEDASAAAAWVGMPEFESGKDDATVLTLYFESDEDRQRLVDQLELTITRRQERGTGAGAHQRSTWNGWWPPRPREDLDSARFDG